MFSFTSDKKFVVLAVGHPRGVRSPFNQITDGFRLDDKGYSDLAAVKEELCHQGSSSLPNVIRYSNQTALSPYLRGNGLFWFEYDKLSTDGLEGNLLQEDPVGLHFIALE